MITLFLEPNALRSTQSVFFAAMPCDVNDAPPSPVQMNILTDKISPHGLPQVIDKRLIR